MRRLANTDARPKILFIAGTGRSGSTILEKTLGEVDGIASLGEVRHLWERGFKNNQLCGCGREFNDCDFWKETSNLAKADYHLSDPELLMDLTSSVERFRHFAYLLFKSFLPGFHETLDFVAENFSKIFRSAKLTCGADFLIDSSGHMHGHVLKEMKGIDLFVVHLVRDGRATAYSWNRSRVYEKHGTTKIMMPKINWFYSSLQWIVGNLAAEHLRTRDVRYLRIRYEDFARHPKDTVKQILAFIGHQGVSIPVSSDSKITFGTQHSVSGNPSRFSQGETSIKPDSEWQQSMSKSSRMGVTLLTSPLLYRYGYFRDNE